MPWRWPWTRTEDRALWQIGDVPASPTWAGVQVNPDTALRLSAVWGCIRILADCISTLPVHAFRGDDQLAELPPLLRQPAAGAALHDWLYQVMVSLLLRGNAYGIVTDRSGATMLPSQVEIAHPDQVGVQVDTDGTVVWRLGGVEQDPADVWHVRAYSFPGSVLGLSPIEYSRQMIGLGLGAERYAAKFFGESAIPAGVLTTDQRITDKDARDLQELWEFGHQGRRRIGVLGAGAKFQPISVNPEESQFLETTKANVAAVARIYGVPPEMIAGESAGHMAYTSPELRSMDLLTYTIRPWLVRLETAISALLPSTQTVRFNPDALVRVALLDRYQAHKVGIEAGFLTRNEARELENRQPLPDDQAGGIA
jgi:HK97 family phage portal protein